MLIKRLALALGLSLVASCASLGAPSQPHGEAQVERFSCPTSKSKVFGSTVSVGSATITAAHVVEDCLSNDEVVSFPEIDLAILKPAKLTSCRAPRVGEKVVFQGYPTTRKNGKPFSTIGARRFETTIGTVAEIDRTINMIDPRTRSITSVTRHAFVDPIPYVRSGYSGGAVTSLETGEFLGIIATGSTGLKLGSFVPAAVICEKMEEVL